MRQDWQSKSALKLDFSNYQLSLFSLQVEYLKIGTYGNRKSAPDAESKEFSQSLLKVIGDGSPEGMKVAETIKTKAMEVGERSRAAGGAQRAGDKILELAG